MNLNGDLLVSFSLLSTGKATLESLDALKGAELDLTAKKHRNKRSLDANAYLWVLCDKIAKKIDSDRERVYVMELERYGQFEDVSIRTEAVEDFRRNIKYTDVRYTGDGWTVVRVFYGSSTYNTKEMSELIDGVVNDAEDLGIETMTPDEIARMKAAWKGLYDRSSRRPKRRIVKSFGNINPKQHRSPTRRILANSHIVYSWKFERSK